MGQYNKDKTSTMIAKLLVMIASIAAIWFLLRMFGKMGRQQKEIQTHRHKEQVREAKAHARREADIIDLEQDPETGSFEEREK